MLSWVVGRYVKQSDLTGQEFLITGLVVYGFIAIRTELHGLSTNTSCQVLRMSVLELFIHGKLQVQIASVWFAN